MCKHPCRIHADIWNTVMTPGHVPLQTRAFDTGTSFLLVFQKMDHMRRKFINFFIQNNTWIWIAKCKNIWNLVKLEYLMKNRARACARTHAHTQSQSGFLNFRIYFPSIEGKHTNWFFPPSPAAKETITKGATALKKDFKGVQIRSWTTECSKYI